MEFRRARLSIQASDLTDVDRRESERWLFQPQPSVCTRQSSQLPEAVGRYDGRAGTSSGRRPDPRRNHPLKAGLAYYRRCPAAFESPQRDSGSRSTSRLGRRPPPPGSTWCSSDLPGGAVRTSGAIPLRRSDANPHDSVACAIHFHALAGTVTRQADRPRRTETGSARYSIHPAVGCPADRCSDRPHFPSRSVHMYLRWRVAAEPQLTTSAGERAPRNATTLLVVAPRSDGGDWAAAWLAHRWVVRRT